jgi:hypothetical protein
MPRRIYKKYVSNCVACPGRDEIYRQKPKEEGDKIVLESWCKEFDQRISTDYLDFNRKMFNFPDFCKLKEER